MWENDKSYQATLVYEEPEKYCNFQVLMNEANTRTGSCIKLFSKT